MSIQVSYKKQTVFFLLLILVVLSLLEGGARIYEYSKPDCYLIGADATKELGSVLQKQMCVEHAQLKINEKPVYSVEPNQHLTTININSHGFRGAEFDLDKNDETYRIMMVGGSTTWGSGASSDSATIPAFLEKKFHSNNHNKVEVINAGVSAANSIEESYKIRQIYKQFQPDLFIIYDGWNDSFGKIQEGNLDVEKSRQELKKQKKNIIQITISEYLTIYRTPYVLYPLLSHTYIASSMNDNILQKNSEIWSSRWNEICTENSMDKIETIILLQPIVGTGNKILSDDEKHHSNYIKQVKSRQQLDYFANQLPISSCTASIDLRNVFDDITIPIYFDGGHTTDIGNEIVAKKIYEDIIPIIMNNKQKSE